MNTNLNKQYEDKDELRQALLELHYDLLDESEATALRTAIVSDADVAAEWANTLKLASNIADAAKLPVQTEPTALAADMFPTEQKCPDRLLNNVLHILSEVRKQNHNPTCERGNLDFNVVPR